MKSTDTSSTAQIEARLHRSLANQVRAPRLDGRFDAAVWARIEAEERKPARAAVVMPVPQAQRWLLASNVGGFIVAAILVLYFGARLLGGMSIDMPSVPMPSMSPQQIDGALNLIGWGITAVSLGFGLMFTPLGRRLRSEFT